MVDWAYLLAAGLLAAGAAFVSGALGAGGGIVLIPLLLYVVPVVSPAGITPHQATALAAVVAFLSTVGGTLHYARTGELNLRALGGYGAVLGVAGLAGGAGSALVSGRVLLMVFAAVTTVSVGLLMVPPRPAPEVPGARRTAAAALLLAGTGLVGGALGVGAGFLMVAVLLHVVGMPTRAAKSVGLALTFFVTLPALVGKAATGQLPLVPSLIVGAATLVAAAAGSYASGLIPERALRWSLAGVTAAAAIRVWVDLFSVG